MPEEEGGLEVALGLEVVGDSTWPFIEGSELVPGCFAWDLLGLGRRFEMWIAWCLDRLTPVCVKLPRRDEMRERTLDALRRELNAATSFDHPAIPRVYASDMDAELPYIVYEFIEGKPLSSVLEDDGPFNSKDVVFLGLQLAAALRHVHNRGFVHLDLKPSNVSIRGGRAILLDFDISLPIGGQRSRSKPRGTRQYMAPEQIRCEPAVPAMDIFALGALLYEAASGVIAFRLHSDDLPSATGEAPSVFRQTGPPIPATGVVAPDLAPSVAAAIDQFMNIEPAARPSTADRAIELLVGSLPEGADHLWPSWVDERLRRVPAGPSFGPAGAGPSRRGLAG